jgi:nuclear transcription factor Y gamma
MSDPISQNMVQEMMTAFWQQQMEEMETGTLDWKFHQLPLARIKKVMKSDDDVKVWNHHDSQWDRQHHQ